MNTTVWMRAAAALAVGLALYGLGAFWQAAVLRSTATAFGWLLGLVGEANHVSDNMVTGAGVRFLVVAECTAVVPIAILLGAIAATPASLRERISGALVGASLLLLLNQVRLLSLWYLDRGAPEHFDWVHAALWQPAMVVAVVGLWILWLGRIG